MAIGSGSKGEEPITAINVTPLVDVCLVLVIIFMAVAPFAVTMGIKVLETRANAAKEGKAGIDDNVTVKLTSDGKLFVNNAQVEADRLPVAIAAALNKSKDRMVIITADTTNKVGQVVSILDMSKLAGAQKLAIMKTEEAKPAGAASGGKG
jgi:biopolymer transport protein ExbD